jgi:hypothetical protein
MNTGTEGVLPSGTNALRQEKLRAEWDAYYARIHLRDRSKRPGDCPRLSAHAAICREMHARK